MYAVKTTMALSTDSLNLVSWLRLEIVFFHQGLDQGFVSVKLKEEKRFFNILRGFLLIIKLIF